jgi:Protein of unknown function (DUF3007)
MFCVVSCNVLLLCCVCFRRIAISESSCTCGHFDFSNRHHAIHCSSISQAKQLKDYENAVIAKRLEELDEDELQALVEEVERDDF